MAAAFGSKMSFKRISRPDRSLLLKPPSEQTDSNSRSNETKPASKHHRNCGGKNTNK